MDDQHHCCDFLPSMEKLNEQKILTSENNSLFVETNSPQRLISLNSVALSDQWNLVQCRTRRKWLDLSGELRSHLITQPNVFKVSGDCWKGKRLIETVLLIVSYRNEWFWFLILNLQTEHIDWLNTFKFIIVSVPVPLRSPW